MPTRFATASAYRTRRTRRASSTAVYRWPIEPFSQFTDLGEPEQE